VTVDGAAVGISNSSTNWGWVAGVGAEWASAGNWSARVEFEYVGLNNQTFTIPASVGGLPAGDQFSGNNRRIELVNAGVNYKFGW
jgi:opacity protein-like surface antigen